MPFIMFTKHLEGYDVPAIISGLKRIGMEGADLCVRPGYPVNPENAATMLPKAVKAFADEGMVVPLVTTPGDFTEPEGKDVEPVLAACGESGVGLIKLGYWRYLDGDDYWQNVSDCRKKLDGFAKIAEKHGVKVVVHTHSGADMGLNAACAMDLVEGFDPKHVGIFLDAGHTSICGAPFNMEASIAGKYLSCFAFKDLLRASATPWGGKKVIATQTRSLGWGLADWDVVVQTVIKEGLQDLPISMHSEYVGDPPESVLDRASADLRFIKALFAELS